MSPSSQLPLDAFPAWARLNDVVLAGAQIQHVQGKGSGLVADADLGASGDGLGDSLDPVLRVPHDLVLSAAAVEEYAKVDQNFKQLLEAAGDETTRIRVLLYLLCHLVHPRRGRPSRGITPTPWTEYIRFLPRPLPVPTMWSEPERLLLNGTSLEAALRAKLSALEGEFDALRDKTEAMPFWNALLWEQGAACLDDWVLVDAWYRSRCLELPQFGDAMVPALDMVNHSASPTAYYDVDGNCDVVLFVIPGCTVPGGQEVAISYGEAKSAAEMLFSYGFVDGDGTARGLTLLLDPLPDDPLAKAKLHIFKGAPVVRFSQDAGTVAWDSPFVYLMCVNEEDGLEFRLLQDTAGGCQLKLFWQGNDVTRRAGEFESLIQDHDMCQVLRLRAVSVLHERVETQLARIRGGGGSEDQVQPLLEERVEAAKALRDAEMQVLEAAAAVFAEEKSTLLTDDQVVAYVGSMEDDGAPRDEDDDFS